MSALTGQRRRTRVRSRGDAPGAVRASDPRAFTPRAPAPTGAGVLRAPAPTGAEHAPTLFTDLGGEPTLGELISGVWEGLAAHHPVPCPLCGGEMNPVYGAHARPSAGRCGDCGTTLD